MSRRFARKLGWNALGLAIFVVMVFPVFWMISTSFKTNDEINGSLTPTLVPRAPDAAELRARRSTSSTSGRT